MNGPSLRVAASMPTPFPPLQELGVSILSDLQRQRETIVHSRDTLHSVDVNVSKSRQVLATMSRRIVQNKVIMWGIILLLVGAIGLVLWSKIFH
jgi:vesicle transport through interaction with t-SNAREs protein 1